MRTELMTNEYRIARLERRVDRLLRALKRLVEVDLEQAEAELVELDEKEFPEGNTGL